MRSRLGGLSPGHRTKHRLGPTTLGHLYDVARVSSLEILGQVSLQLADTDLHVTTLRRDCGLVKERVAAEATERVVRWRPVQPSHVRIGTPAVSFTMPSKLRRPRLSHSFPSRGRPSGGFDGIRISELAERTAKLAEAFSE